MPFTLTCKHCGKPFQAKTRRGKVCFGACFRAAENEANARRQAGYSPERKRAAIAVQTAIYNGTLRRQPCEVCGKRSYVDAHHDDYSKPLEVRWLCRSHHRQHHLRFGKGKAA